MLAFAWEGKPENPGWNKDDTQQQTQPYGRYAMHVTARALLCQYRSPVQCM